MAPHLPQQTLIALPSSLPPFLASFDTHPEPSPAARPAWALPHPTACRWGLGRRLPLTISWQYSPLGTQQSEQSPRVWRALQGEAPSAAWGTRQPVTPAGQYRQGRPNGRAVGRVTVPKTVSDPPRSCVAPIVKAKWVPVHGSALTARFKGGSKAAGS